MAGTPAQIKIYKDQACSQELESFNGEYVPDFGAPEDGKETVFTYYAKNISPDNDAPATLLKKISDPRGYWQVSSNGSAFYTTQATTGDFAPLAVKPIYLKCVIPLGATQAQDIACTFKVTNAA